MLEGCDTIDSINRMMKIINYSVGWIQPIAFFSYRSFSKATDYYVKALRQKAFAHSPESFVGRKVEFSFRPDKVLVNGDTVTLINGRVHIICKNRPGTRGEHISYSPGKVVVSGIVGREGNVIIIKADSIKPVRE